MSLSKLYVGRYFQGKVSSFETSGATCPEREHHVPGDQQYTFLRLMTKLCTSYNREKTPKSIKKVYNQQTVHVKKENTPICFDYERNCS